MSETAGLYCPVVARTWWSGPDDAAIPQATFIMNTSQQTITVDIVLFQPRLNDVRLIPARVDGESLHERLSAIGFADSEFETVEEFITRIASRYSDVKSDVPFGNVPPPSEDDTIHVYKIGEIGVDEHGEVVAERFEDALNSHHILGKDGGEKPHN